MIKTIFLVFVAMIVTFAIAVYVHLGAYKVPKVGMKMAPAMTLLYTTHVGPYNEVAPLMDKVQQWATEHNLTCEKTFGEYLDNPETTDQRRLQSRVGCVVDSRFAPKDLDKIVATGPYKIEKRLPGRYLWASFDGSPSIGPFKVYPRMRKYARVHHLKTAVASLEVYTVQGSQSMTTDYYIAIQSAADAVPVPSAKKSSTAKQ